MKTFKEHIKKGGPKRILSLDGGGIRGALTLGFVERIENILQERYDDKNLRLCDYFDLIGGTSTGSIISAALAVGMSAKEIKEMYLDIGDDIFGVKYKWWQIWSKRSRFDFSPLDKALSKIFGDVTLSSDKIKTGLCIVAKRADTFSTWPVINHPEGKYFKYNKDILLRKMVRASTAAPSYFLPQEIEVSPGQKAVFVDGAVSMANNPALQLFLVATLNGFPFHWDTGEDKILLCSIGTGKSKPKLDSTTMSSQNLLKWAALLPDMFMNDANYLNQTILQYLSNSPTALEIDSEIGKLDKDLLGGKAHLSYNRYNVLFEKDEINQFGFNYSQKEVDDLMEMSAAENRYKLAEIGEKAAAKLLKPEHLPAAFDLK